MLPEHALLFAPTPGGPALYAQLESAILGALPDVEICPRRTQLGFFHGCGFAWAWPARAKADRMAGRIGLTLALPARVDSPRIAHAVEAYPGRWTHHMLISSPREIDGELMNWLREAWSFAAFRGKRNPRTSGR